MKKIPTKNKLILRIVLLSFLSIPVLFILFVIGSILLSPVFDGIDKARFEKLDSQSKELFNHLKTVSGGDETWVYKAICEEQMSGPWPTGDYTCTALMSSETTITSVDQLNALQDKYYPIIDSSKTLEQKTNLDKEYPGQFGVEFVSSTAEKKYTSSDGNMTCTYLANLSDGKNIEYGLTLNSSNAIVAISLQCTGKSRGDWYNS